MSRAFILSITLGFCVLAHAETVRPNVLFTISDELTAEALSCYGNVQSKTPNIDRLANAGIQFNRAYTHYPICGPTRAAFQLLISRDRHRSLGMMAVAQQRM